MFPVLNVRYSRSMILLEYADPYSLEAMHWYSASYFSGLFQAAMSRVPERLRIDACASRATLKYFPFRLHEKLHHWVKCENKTETSEGWFREMVNRNES